MPLCRPGELGFKAFVSEGSVSLVMSVYPLKSLGTLVIPILQVESCHLPRNHKQGTMFWRATYGFRSIVCSAA